MPEPNFPQDPTFVPASSNPFGLTNVGDYAMPTLVDIDGDGDLDAFVGNGAGNTLFYRNTGSASAPAFAAPSTNPYGLTNVVNGAMPTFVDIDNDGDLDAFVGSHYGDTRFYRNTGSASAPTFATPSINPFGLVNVGNGAAPTFVDIDGDGDLDAFVGDSAGNIRFYRNTGSASAPAFATASTNPFGLTDVGSFAKPTFVDIDGDGDLDALVGNLAGNTLFYRNTGSASAPTFAAASTNPFGLANVGLYAKPALADIDGDGDLDAFIGNSAGNTLFYQNVPWLAIAATTAIQTEGDTGTKAFTFTVTRSGDTSDSSSVNWAVTGTGTNQANAADFGVTLPSGTVNFAANETSQVITVNVSGDTDFEANEGFTVTLSSPTNAYITTATATGTITNDDLPSITLAVAPGSVNEDGTTNLVYTFTRTGPTTNALTVNYSITGTADSSDYSGATPGTGKTITFAANSATVTVTVDPVFDLTFEPDETVVFTLTEGTGYTVGTASTATGTITNDDPGLAIAATNAIQTEGDTGTKAFTFTVTRSGKTSGTSSANWAVTGTGTNPANATDFGGILPSGTVSFAANETSKTITVNVSGDIDIETNEGFTVTLSSPTNATITTATATGTILNDDPKIALSNTLLQVTEDGATATYTVVLNDAPTADVILTLNPGRQLSLSQTSLTFTSANWDTPQTVTVTAVNDTIGEGPHRGVISTTVSSSDSVYNGIPVANVLAQITDNDIAQQDPTFAPASTNPFGLPDAGDYTTPTLVDIDNDGDLDAFVGDFFGNTLFYRNTGSASAPAFAAGSTNPFGLTDVGLYAAPTFVDIDGDGDLDAFIGNEEGNTLFYRNTGSASAPTFAAPSTNPFGLTDVIYDAVPTLVDIDDDGDLDAFIGNYYGNTLFYRNTGSASAPAFATPSTNPFGLTNVVTYAQPTFVDIDGDGDLDAFIGNELGNTLFYRNTGSASAPTFAAPSYNPFGLTDVVYDAAPTLVDIDGDGDLDAFIGNWVGNTLFYENVPWLAIAATNASQTEGDTGTKAFTFTVTRSGDTSDSSSVNWAVTVTGTNQANAADFGETLPSGTVNFAANETSQTITVNVSGDTDVELDEGFTVTLSSPTNAYITTATATGTITNDDLPGITLAVAPGSVNEDGTTNLVYTFTRTGLINNPLTVNYSITGTAESSDYSGATPGTGKTITFAANSATATVTVDPTADTIVEPDETVVFTLTEGTGYTLGTASTATGTITNDDTSVTVAVAPGSVTEDGTTNLVYTFTRTGLTTNPLTVNYTVSGTATNGTDYASIPTSVNFLAGSATATVTVDPTTDTTMEPDETVILTLAGGTGYTVGTANTATGTIQNDDDDPALAITPSTLSQTEGNTGTKAFTFTVTRSGDTSGSSSANWTVTGTGTNQANATDFVGGTLPSGTVSFAANETSQIITVNVSGDTTVETNEEFTVTLSNPTNATITTAAATGTIQNDDDDPALAITPSTLSQTEGNTGTKAFTFTVNRSGNTTGTSSANWTVTGTGTNQANATDFVGGILPSGTVSFAANETSQIITVNVSGDTTVEPDEGFTVTLDTPTNATITTAAATGTIQNDDDDPALAITPSTLSQTEGNTGTKAFTFTVNRSGNTTGTSSANWTVTGTGTNQANATDFVGGILPSGTVSFAANETSQIITVNVSGDTTVEPDEGFTVTLDTPTNATITTATATGTIQNDDDDPALAITPSTLSQTEGNTGTKAFTFTVTRSGNTTGTSSANWTVTGTGTNQANATDFVGGTLPSGTVSFAANETSQIITVNVSGDTTVETNEEFTVTLSNPTNATITTATATGTIQNDDDDPALAITPSTLSQTEGNTGTKAFTFTVTRSGDTSGSSSANWTVTGTGTNQANATDFVGGILPSGTVSFAANETSQTITVNVSGDTTVEPDEGFTVTLDTPTNATITTATATGTIQNDDDDPALAITPSTLSQTEGNTGTKAFTFTVTRSGDTSGSSSANWTVTGTGTNQANATDFVGGILPSGTVSFAANETSQTITVNVSGDTTVEPDEGFTVTLDTPTNATITTATATGTIQNDDTNTNQAPVITSSNSATVLENASISTLIYTAAATDTDGPVNQIVWSLGGNDASAFTIGSNNGEVRLKASADYETKSSYSIDVIATDQNGSGVSTNKTVTIGVIDQAVFSINNVTVNENAGTAIFTVTATDPISNGTSTATVNYATANGTAFGSTIANGDYVSTSGSLSFGTGDSSKTISVVINDDTLYEPTPETFSVNLSNPTNGAIANSTSTGTINDNDSLPIISAQPSQVLEGNSGTTTQLIFQVSLSARSGQDVSVDYSVTAGTATAGNDYVSTSGTLRLTAGTLSGTITVPVQGDTDVEPDETLTLILSNPVGTTISSGSITGKIINDDNTTGAITFTGTSGKDNLSGNLAAPPTTVPDEVFRGLGGDDNLFGYFGTNTFEGGPGADNLLGYSGKDTFFYPNFSDSLLNSMDTISRFNSTEGDRLQLSSLPSKLSYAGVITATSLSNATSQAYAAANLQANESLLFRYGSSYYLSVNDGTAAFNGTADLLVKFGSLLNAPTTAGTLNVNHYFTI
ncbi:Alkaline phosphatase [Microcystis aeruginosa NIES-2481]|uniref:beta strand repeat-containing protein n=1 Tax=Microcystis aeruginosa TaxID=1126 RepID=UPI00081FDFB5|nr:Calx-beta domain-containing protein [Microcystis aeruginosa]AOC54544.1 Alkaline phosphatase [Microcystis aeruginosa NIES-2481]